MPFVFFGFESKIGVELLHRGAFSHRQIDAHQLGGDAAGAQVLAEVEGVARAGHVLRELGDAVFGIVDGGDEVAGRGLAHGRGA